MLRVVAPSLRRIDNGAPTVLRYLGFQTAFRAIAQVVSVQVWGTWGRQFESGLPDIIEHVVAMR